MSTAAHSGTQPGCGDCEWTLIMACVYNSPDDPTNQKSCVGATRGAGCRRGQVAYRLYLTTDAVSNRLVDTLCLGGLDDVVPVGDIAAADVSRYLRDLRPPLMQLGIQPPHGVPAGLPAYFMVRPPASLAPQPFGSSQVTETITITPASYRWDWGDGTPALTTDDPGAPYPDGKVVHTYARAGHVSGMLRTEWSAAYTITVAGDTFGPYDATGGTIARQQSFTVVVDSAHSQLVS